ncbi:hypothetical protein [Streptomyces sp. CNQ085]|uniref:hypothetical protein n=1 Tax=Streptomyces sp. CNQ085 TaxID=2886944 RepID=UPI001F508975|nr:hypothetical protein [Streptomyces sp. CNQ085]MCI0385309.1 hypothetical protein [Streptomyces sp. CNQ085]
MVHRTESELVFPVGDNYGAGGDDNHASVRGERGTHGHREIAAARGAVPDAGA